MKPYSFYIKCNLETSIGDKKLPAFSTIRLHWQIYLKKMNLQNFNLVVTKPCIPPYNLYKYLFDFFR